jgi:uncharacterized phiE125 gp8 family phage protein
MSEVLAPMGEGEVLDYRIDAAAHLLQAGETLVEGQSSIIVVGATKDGQVFTGTDVTMWLSGATAGTPIKITANLKTSGGRKFNRIYVIPFGEPVSLDDAKAHLRVDDDGDDALIAGYISAARRHVEDYTGQALVRRGFVQEFTTFGLALELAKRPLGDVTAVAYTDQAGLTRDYSDFVVQFDRGRVFPARDGWWPTLGRYGSIQVAYTAGYDEGGVPEPLTQAMLLLIGHWYANREGTVTGTGAAAIELPIGVQDLCSPYRRVLL